MENFIGTLSGKLVGLDRAGLKIDSEDNFSVTADGEKVISIENLQNGTLTSDDLDAITINGENVSVDDLEEATLTIQDGELKTSAEVDSGTIVEEILNLEDAIIVSGKENLTLLGGDAVIVEDTNAKVSITASKGKDTIYTSGSNVDIDLKAGGAIEIFAAQGRATVENYKATSGAAFLTENENIADAIADNSIAYDDGKLTVNSARATLQSVSSGDDAARILTIINGKETKTAIAQEGGIIATGDELADVYYGKKSGVDFTGFENSLTIDLSKNFYGINQITVGGGQNTLTLLTTDRQKNSRATNIECAFQFVAERINFLRKVKFLQREPI